MGKEWDAYTIGRVFGIIDEALYNEALYNEKSPCQKMTWRLAFAPGR